METKHVTLNVDRGIDWDSAVKQFQENGSNKLDGFYCSKREQKGQRLYLLAIQKKSSIRLFNITRPNTGRSPFEEEKADLLHKYNKISLPDAESGWKAQYERTRDHCIHGLGCKTGPSCKTGCRITQINLLCGGIIPLLSALELAMAKHADKLGLTKESRSLRVVRVELDSGQRLVGLRYPEQLIPEVTLFLKEQKVIDSVLEKQSGVLGVAGPSQETSKASQAYEEAEAPINPRTLTKATTPLVTIKNFFKPRVVETTPEHDGNASEKVEEASGENGCTKKDCGMAITDSPFPSTKTTTNKQSVPEKNSKGVKSVYFKSQGSNHEKAPQEKTSAGGLSRMNGLVSHLPDSLSKENLQRKASLKRANSDTASRTNKRQKQSSILSSFGKKTEKLVDETKKEIYCPVCGVKFANEVKNVEINKHIDGCLTK